MIKISLRLVNMAPIMAKDGSVLQNGDLEEFLEKNLKEAKVLKLFRTRMKKHQIQLRLVFESICIL